MQDKITVRGYTIGREAEYGGLMIVRDADGNKIGSTQTETAARLIVRNDERRKAREADASRYVRHPRVWPNYIDRPER